MNQIADKIYGFVLGYGLNILAAILIFIVGKWLAGFASRLIEKIMLKAKVDQTLTTFARSMIYIALMAFVIIAVLGKLGVQTTSFIAVIGAAGLAVGLALQGALSNFAAGVMLILFKTFKVDDYIEAGGAAGIVHEVEIFNTILMTSDHKRVIVPNSKITGDKVTVYPPAGK